MILPVKNNGANAIYTGNDRTLCYGVDDIRVNDSSNGNASSYANLGNNYNGPNGLNGTAAANYLIGASNFQTVEIEVFQIIFPLLSRIV